MLFCTPVFSQMSITTIGANDAAACFQNAASDRSRDTSPCDRVLRDPRTEDRDRLKTLVNRGIIYNRAGKPGEARADFNAALAIDNTVGEAYLNRGNSSYLSGDFSGALKDYKLALANNVSKPWAAWYNIGLAHEALGANDAAREAFARALALKPDFRPAQKKLSSMP